MYGMRDPGPAPGLLVPSVNPGRSRNGHPGLDPGSPTSIGLMIILLYQFNKARRKAETLQVSP
ncbi:MAG TPA: hypothetical protein VM935_15685 [Chitinophagaceae bacterium]|nr:hypothetical protein [Chitinophagaceae bacterium]